MPPELLSQFPIAERAIEALGLTLWSMLEFEADDAIAAAVARFGDSPEVSRILVCTPDKDLAQCVVGKRIVLWDRRRRIIYDDAGVRAKWGVAPASIPDWLALVGDAADGFPGLPGWGAKSAAAVLARFGSLEAIPANPASWKLPVRGAEVLAATLRERMPEVLLYRTLARLRSDAPIPQRAPAELAWLGTPRAGWEAFCDELGLDRLRSRPHRWADA